jgi:two-component system, chemotaxis family, chemotaxis protein CheY
VRRALVADDSRAMRMILSRTLVALGFAVVQASNGREAVEAINLEGPTLDLALLDWNMPELNGLEVVRHIRADPRCSNIQVMMVTTETETEQVVKALEAGANEYVMKPFTADVVENKLRMMGVIE